MINAPSNVVIATLCINEMEWLPRSYEQHKDWPGLVRWIFVESADLVYAQTNPHMTDNGLSKDGTSEFLKEIASKDERVCYIPYGYSNIHNQYAPDQGKCEARNRYLDIADMYRPDLLIVLDADEFYTHHHQKVISNLLRTVSTQHHPRLNYKGSAFCFKQRHIWFPPYLQEPRNKKRYPQYGFMTHEAVRGYWEVIHCRIWRWERNLRYIRNHNWPEVDGEYLINRGEYMLRTDSRTPPCLAHTSVPECIHFGFASRAQERIAKHRYYQERGEGKESSISLRKRRMMYVECRNAYKAWEPGDTLPHRAQIIPYKGPIPECFREQVDKQANAILVDNVQEQKDVI